MAFYANRWNNTANTKLRLTNMNERVLQPCWNLGKTSKRSSEPESNYRNETYREDIYMVFSNKLPMDAPFTTEDILLGIKEAKIEPKDIGGIQRKASGTEIMCLSEKSYEILIEEGIKVGEQKEAVTFKPKRKRSQPVKIFGLGMDVYDAILEEELCKYGKIIDGKQHQLKIEKSISDEWKHVSNGDRVVYMVIERSIPRKLMVANEWITVWYVGQPKMCIHCNENHKSEQCKNIVCYNCRERGHIAKECEGLAECPKCRLKHRKEEPCQQATEEEHSDYENISSDEASPEYSPMKAEKQAIEEWTEDQVEKTIEKEKTKTLYRKKTLKEEAEKLKYRISEEQFAEASKISEALEVRKAVMIYFQHKSEIEEIRRDPKMEMTEKEAHYEKHMVWMYGALQTMAREKVVGTHNGIIIRAVKKKRSRHDTPSNKDQRDKNAKNSRLSE